ncbi:unnamed protein product [Parnassius apollo]|uniref:(apollo) hypothetical protein n=1 Tax=Parnassius apollo TaxID=110799 RepID=A0A8S3WQI9_PARAO|nr:unnamed protein product [Parnassius apollo]
MKLKKGIGSSIRKAKVLYSVDTVWPLDLANRAQFDEEGFNDWRNAEVRVAQHEKSLNHKSCILALRAREEVMTNLDNGTYIMLLELIAEFDPLLTEHIERFANQGSGTTSYLSKTVRDEFIYLMAEKVLIYISDEIKKAKYLSLIVDSTLDAAHIDQLTLVIQYVLDNGETCEIFIKFLPSLGHKTQVIFDTITIELEKLNINLKDCRSQSYDNTSNMSGIHNSLQAKIQEQA